ncbi:MAG: hypothetical protein K5675_09105, partial [Lachnospiraceae bacterium]|nr:hypothetical protein [Lachnospiraceae bacterium]
CILGRELPLFDGILDLFSKRLQNQKWPVAGTALIFFAFLDMFFQRWYLDTKTLGIQCILLLGAAILLGDETKKRVSGFSGYLWIFFGVFTLVSELLYPKFPYLQGLYVFVILFLATQLKNLVPVCRGLLLTLPVVVVANFMLGSVSADMPVIGLFTSSEELAFYGMAIAVAGMYLLDTNAGKKKLTLEDAFAGIAIVAGAVFVRVSWENMLLAGLVLVAAVWVVLRRKKIFKGKMLVVGVISVVVGAAFFFVVKMPGLYQGLETTLKTASVYVDRSIMRFGAFDSISLLGRCESVQYYCGILQVMFEKGVITTLFLVLALAVSVYQSIRQKNYKSIIIVLAFVIASLNWNVEVTGGNPLWLMAYVAIAHGLKTTNLGDR